MIIELKKFGEMLISRPAGKEAYLVAQAYSLPQDVDEEITVDFSGVKVLAPSWADEFLTPLKRRFAHVDYVHDENPSVQATLQTIAV